MIQAMSNVTLKGKRVMIREDFNVPMKDGQIMNDARLRAALPTIQYALDQHASVILLSHLGRPKEGEFNKDYSLAPIADYLTHALNRPVRLLDNWLDYIDINPGEVVLCENVRFNVGEKANDENLAKRMAQLCDVFVMDAFGSAHRAHASTHGVARYAPIACAGPLLTGELNALTKAFKQPEHPLLAIIGGSKVSTKLIVLKELLNKVDQLIVGGGIANTFLAAAGFPIGKSLYEADLISTAKELLIMAEQQGARIPLPVDVVVAKEFAANHAEIKLIADVADDDMILDIGPQTSAMMREYILQAKTIIWNGPVGVFEIPAFAKGTEELAKAIAESEAYSLAGGGDTLAAIEEFKVENNISYISTGGGAFLEFIEGKILPSLKILEECAHASAY